MLTFGVGFYVLIWVLFKVKFSGKKLMCFCLFSPQILIVIISCPSTLPAGISAGMARSNKARVHLAGTGVWTHTLQKGQMGPATCHSWCCCLCGSSPTLVGWIGDWMWLERRWRLAKCFDKGFGISPGCFFLWTYILLNIFLFLKHPCWTHYKHCNFMYSIEFVVNQPTKGSEYVLPNST